MIKITRYFENPFKDPEISGEELRSFAEDHTGKIADHAAMLSATQAAFDPFDAALGERAQQIGALGGGTATKEEVLQLFRTKIRQRRGRVIDKYGEASAEYREIFPGGLTYYTEATMETAQTRLDYAKDKFVKFKAGLGADLEAEFTKLAADFKAARGAQVGGKGNVSQARDAVKATRRALELQLLDNLLSLAKEFKGQPEKAAVYFDQSKLEDPTQSQTSESAKPAAAKS